VPSLTQEQVAQIRRIELRARRTTATLLGGDYRSVFRGTGIEFAEAREYVPGDDVRRIDWNVTARMGTPWVKEFVEERELTVMCAVDVSASQLVARPESGRLGVAAELSALLWFAAAYSNDRGGLLTFGGEVERFVPPERGTRHALRLVREVLHHSPPAPGTNIAGAVEYLTRILRRRSVVFLLSDFFDSDFEQSLTTLARRHEVIALSLIDPLDRVLPDIGLVELEAAETGERLLLDSSDATVRERYAAAAKVRSERRRRALTSAGVDEIEIPIGGDTVGPVIGYFHRRALSR
jgi:uncharacterized protein (DUF58 family)